MRFGCLNYPQREITPLLRLKHVFLSHVNKINELQLKKNLIYVTIEMSMTSKQNTCDNKNYYNEKTELQGSDFRYSAVQVTF